MRARQSSVWIDGYRQLYTAIGSAAELLSELSTLDLAMPSFDDGAGALPHRLVPHRPALPPVHLRPPHLRGTRTRSTRCASRSRSATPTSSSTSWATPGRSRSTRPTSGARPRCARRRSFYGDYVEPLVRDDKKAVVIISDALRYEVADELGSRIRQEDRFDADLEAVLGVLPSYTQLGMAALLPHRTLKHSADGKTVLADDQPTNGTAFRSKILEAVGGTAIQAEDFKALSPEERRELYKDNRVLYVYHNRIDATGDKPGTERQVFEAAEDSAARRWSTW